MSEPGSNRNVTTLRRLVGGIAGLIVALGLVVLAGWIFGGEWLKRVAPGILGMNQVTAVAFIFAGVALALVRPGLEVHRGSAVTRGLRLTLAASVVGVGLLGWVESLAVRGAPAEVGMLARQLTGTMVGSSRMAPNTAFNLVVLGVALMLVGSRRNRWITVAQWLSVLAAVVAVLGLIGHAYAAQALKGVAGYVPMAMHTGIGFLILSAGVLAVRADSGLTVDFISPARTMMLDSSSDAQGHPRLTAGRSNVLFARRITTGFGAAALFLFLLGLVSYRSTNRFGQTFRQVDQSHRVLVQLEETLTAMLDVEAGVRGFLITGDEPFLELQQRGVVAVKQARRELRQFAADHPAQLRDLTELDGLIDRALVLAQERVQQNRGARASDAASQAGTREGNRVLDEIRQLVARMESTERALLGRRSAVAQVLASFTQKLVLLGSVLAFLLVGLAAWRVRADLHWRLAAEARLVKASGEIYDLYNHAPCGYHSLDANGVFVSINDTELAWLGYSREEIVGKMRFAELLTPASQQKFAGHLPGIETSGKIQDLDFDLIRKDGSLLPVSVNSTAIWEANGKLVERRSSVFDNTERQRATEKIRRLNKDLERRADQLEATNRELESFSYSVSHDLRAPLRHIDGFVNLLEKGAALGFDEKCRGYMKIISDSARRMGQLIDDLLSFSRMSLNELKPTPVNLRGLVEETIRQLEREAPGRRFEWHCHDLPKVGGDVALLRQVFLNLLSNAVKYTRPRDPARIEVGTRESAANEVVIFVRDNGVGFDMQYAGRLFGVFQRLHRADEFEGTGVGLANVRRIIARHGGRTWAEGAAGVGATFYFSLPVRPTERTQA